MKQYFFLLLLIFLLAAVAVTASAEPAAPFTLTWDAVAAGGVSSGGSYTLADAVGQPAAGASSGGNYTLVDGFISGIGGGLSPAASKIYLPLLVR